jgi:hypothetical protein
MVPISGARWLNFMNPLEWGPWLYGKWFANHNPILGYLFACTIAVFVALVAWTQIKEKYEAEHPTKSPSAQLEVYISEVSRFKAIQLNFENIGDMPKAMSAAINGQRPEHYLIPLDHYTTELNIIVRNIGSAPSKMLM